MGERIRESRSVASAILGSADNIAKSAMCLWRSRIHSKRKMGKGMTTIRPATHDDTTRLMELAVAMHAESPRFSKLEFSHEKMLNLFYHLIDSEFCMVIVAERSGQVVGGLAAIVSEHWISNDLVANDLAVFMQKDARGSTAPARMIAQYVEWAKAKGAKFIQLGISTGVMVEKTSELYRSLGLHECSIGFEV